MAMFQWRLPSNRSVTRYLMATRLCRHRLGSGHVRQALRLIACRLRSNQPVAFLSSSESHDTGNLHNSCEALSFTAYPLSTTPAPAQLPGK